MSSDNASDREIATRVIECLNHPDAFERMKSLTADDFVWKTARGQEVQAILPDVLKVIWSNLEGGFAMRVHGTIAENGRVAVEAESHAPLKNGTLYNNFYHFLVQVENGKVRSVTEHCDTKHADDILSPVFSA